MNHLRTLSGLIVLYFAGAAQAQTIQLACKVKWDARCNNALMDYRDCVPEFGPETSEGTLEIVGNTARTKNLGVVNEYTVTRRSANEFEFEGAKAGDKQMRGWGVLDTATWKLKLVFSQEGFSGGLPGALQRGLEGDCR